MKRKLLVSLLPALAAIIVLAGCPAAGPNGSDGSDGNGGIGPTSTKTVAFDEDISGYVLLSTTSNTFAHSTDDADSNHVYHISAGDGPFGQVERAFLSFDLSLPSGASEIVSARLYAYPELYSNSPFANLGGQLEVYGVHYGSSLDGPDYYAGENEGPFILSTTTANEDSWVDTDVTLAVKNAFTAGENRVQFKIRFPDNNNSDANPDGVDIDADESGTDYPYLEIEYR